MTEKFISNTDTRLYILMSLRCPRQCHGISDYIERTTKGQVKPGAGTVYSAVSRMRRNNIIAVYDDRGHSAVYELTDLGRSILRSESERIARLYRFMGTEG
ncbi:MAG: helix-turn-helix transcriptional regulator [Ruminococcus sp.]|nr:helix-turn-helix transcriptional regulator [Ruminococcus sp.]